MVLDGVVVVVVGVILEVLTPVTFSLGVLCAAATSSEWGGGLASEIM